MATPSRFMRPPTRPVGQGWDDPPSSVDARPVNVAYDPQTGPGTGSPSRRMGTMSRNGIVRPVTAMGSATGPLTTPNRTMSRGPIVDPVKLSEAKARAALKFNQENLGLHRDEVTGFVTVRSDAESRIANAATGNEVHSGQAPQKPAGVGSIPASPTPRPFMDQKPMPSQSTYGQAASMQSSMAPNLGQDRWGRTSASPSAFGAPRQASPPSSPPAMPTPTNSGYQGGVAGTTRMSGPYGGGSVNTPTSASNVARVADAVKGGNGIIGKFSAGMQAAAQKLGAPTLASKAPSNATFDGQSRDQFFGAAAARQGTSNMFASRPMPGSSAANTASAPPAATPTPATPTTLPPASTTAAPAAKINPDGSLPPSSLAPPVQPQFPAGSLEQRAQSLGNAATNSANFAGAQAIANNSGAGNLSKQQPSPFFAQKPMPTAPTPTPAAPSAPIAGSGFTGPAGEAAAKQAVQQGRADEAASAVSAANSMNTLDKFSPSTFRPTPIAETTDKNAARGFNDSADLARYKAEDAGNQAGNAPTVQVTDEMVAEAERLKKEQELAANE